MNYEQAAWWLAGIIDGEGCVSYSGGARELTITNTDGKILSRVRGALIILGVDDWYEHWEELPNRKPCCRICVTGRKRLEILARLPLQSDKKEKFASLLASYKRSPVCTDSPATQSA
jgi:hypothetical protein